MLQLQVWEFQNGLSGTRYSDFSENPNILAHVSDEGYGFFKHLSPKKRMAKTPPAISPEQI